MENQNGKLSVPRVVASDRSYEQARDRAITRMRQGLSMGLGERPGWTRDELHER
jgi:hypothetical protein